MDGWVNGESKKGTSQDLQSTLAGPWVRYKGRESASPQSPHMYRQPAEGKAPPTPPHPAPLHFFPNMLLGLSSDPVL